MTWRSLYACRNGWRRLRPGCIHALELPSVASTAEFLNGYPTYCVLDGRDLGWTVAGGDASELLVVNAWEGLQVVLSLALMHLLSRQACTWLTSFHAARWSTARRGSCCRRTAQTLMSTTSAWRLCQQDALLQLTMRALTCLLWTWTARS